MRRAIMPSIWPALVVAAGCMTRHELVVEPNEATCQMYGVTQEHINRAIASGPRDVKALGQTIVKVLPDGTVIRLRQVASIRYRERGKR